MYKLVVLSALLAVVSAKPSGIGLSYPIAAPVVAPVLHPAPAVATVTGPAFSTVSRTFRTDILHPPTVKAFSAPVIASPPIVHTAFAAPIARAAYVAPLVSSFAAPRPAPVFSRAFVGLPTPAFGYGYNGGYGCLGCGYSKYAY